MFLRHHLISKHLRLLFFCLVFCCVLFYLISPTSQYSIHRTTTLRSAKNSSHNNPFLVHHWSPELELQDRSFTNDERIFFHETSGRGMLDFKQTCSIESAAKHHPTRPVQVFLSSASINNETPWLEILSNYNNTVIILLDSEKYLKGTELEQWYSKGLWKTSQFKLAHLSDYLRVNTISRGGGLYVDLDIIIRKPFSMENFTNFFVYESKSYDMVANAIFHLKKNHPVIREIVKIIASEYDPEEYIFHGPEAITAALHYVCGLLRGDPNTNNCAESTRIWPNTLIKPIDTIFTGVLFTDEGMQEKWRNKVEKSHAVHYFSSIGHVQLKNDNLMAEMNSEHLFASLARANCPLTFSQAFAFV